MATRSIPAEFYAVGSPEQINLLIVNYNPRGTICPACRAIIGRVYTYGWGNAPPPHLPLHSHCYCYYEPTTEGIVYQEPEPTDPIPIGPDPYQPIPEDPTPAPPEPLPPPDPEPDPFEPIDPIDPSPYPFPIDIRP